MEDLQHMGPDGTCWREEFNKVLEQFNRPKCLWFKDCGGLADYKTLNGKIDGKKSISWGKQDCGGLADYKTLNGKIDGRKSENWGELGYSNNHLYHWNLCGKCHKEESGEDETATDWSDDGEVMCENCGEWGEDCVAENWGCGGAGAP